MPGPVMGSNDGKGRYLVVSTTYDEKVPGFRRVDSGTPILVPGMGVEIRQQQAHSRIPFVGIVCENRSCVAACPGRHVMCQLVGYYAGASGVSDINTGGDIIWH